MTFGIRAVPSSAMDEIADVQLKLIEIKDTLTRFQAEIQAQREADMAAWQSRFVIKETYGPSAPISMAADKILGPKSNDSYPGSITTSENPVDEGLEICEMEDSAGNGGGESESEKPNQSLVDASFCDEGSEPEVQQVEAVISTTSFASTVKEQVRDDPPAFGTIAVQNGVSKLFAEMSESNLEEALLSIEVPKVVHYRFHEMPKLYLVDPDEEPYNFSYVHGESMVYSYSIFEVGCRLFDPGGCSLPHMGCSLFEFNIEQGDYGLDTIGVDTSVKVVIHEIWIIIASVCGVIIINDRAFFKNGLDTFIEIGTGRMGYYVIDCSVSNSLVNKALMEWFEVLCKRGFTVSSKGDLMTAFFLSILRKCGNEKLCNEATNETPENAAELFIFIYYKVLFADFNWIMVVWRLLYDVVIAEPEMNMLTESTQQGSVRFISKMKRMVKKVAMVSALGFGCMGLSGTYNAPLPEEDGIAIIKEAYHRGVTFFDTSDVYGKENANEYLVGKALKELPREKVQLATKFGIYSTGSTHVGVKGTPEYARSCCEGSLKRLQVDYIDLYYIHRIDTTVPIEETIGELKKLVEEGKIKYIGLSESNTDTIRRAHAVHPITAIQMEYSLWTRDIEQEIIPLCRELGIGVVPYSPVGRGLFAGKAVVESLPENSYLVKHPRFTGENFEKNKQIYYRLETLSKKHGCTPAQLALAWVIHQGNDIVPIPGTTKIKNLHDNIGSVKVKLTEEDIKEISDAVPINEVAGKRNNDAILRTSYLFATTPLPKK